MWRQSSLKNSPVQLLVGVRFYWRLWTTLWLAQTCSPATHRFCIFIIILILFKNINKMIFLLQKWCCTTESGILSRYPVSNLLPHLSPHLCPLKVVITLFPRWLGVLAHNHCHSPGTSPNVGGLGGHSHLLEAAVKTLRNERWIGSAGDRCTLVALKKKFSSVISGEISRNSSSCFNPTQGSLMNLAITNTSVLTKISRSSLSLFLLCLWFVFVKNLIIRDFSVMISRNLTCLRPRYESGSKGSISSTWNKLYQV